MSFNGHSVSAKHAPPKPYEWYLWGWSKGSGPPPMPSLTQYGYSIVFFFSALNSPKLLHYLTELTVRLVVVVAGISPSCCSRYVFTKIWVRIVIFLVYRGSWFTPPTNLCPFSWLRTE